MVKNLRISQITNSSYGPRFFLTYMYICGFGLRGSCLHTVIHYFKTSQNKICTVLVHTRLAVRLAVTISLLSIILYLSY